MMEKYEQAVYNWRMHDPQTEGEYLRLLADFTVLFSYHSARLECDAVTFSDTRDIFLTERVCDYSGEISVLQEILNHKRCWELICARLSEGRSLSVELAQTLYEQLSCGMADSGQEQPLPDDKERLRELLEEVNAYKGDRTLKAATYLHAAVVYLAPFGRYSGKIARLLMNFYLLSHGHPPIVVYSFDGDLYRECLERFTELEELNPLYKFFQYELERLWLRSDSMFESVV